MAILLFDQLFDFLFGVLQHVLTRTSQLDAALEVGQRLFQVEFTLFELFNQAFQFAQRLLEIDRFQGFWRFF